MSETTAGEFWEIKPSVLVVGAWLYRRPGDSLWHFANLFSAVGRMFP